MRIYRSSSISFRFAHRSIRKLLTFTLLFNLLILPTPQFAYQVSALTHSFVRFVTKSARMASALLKPVYNSAPALRRRDRLADRVAQVARIRISPRRFVAYQGQTRNFSALPVNFDDQTIQGVKFSWESSDTNKVQIDDAGLATFLQPGLARITCRAGTAQSTIPVLVRPGRRPRQSDEEWRADQQTLSEILTGGIATGADTGLLSSLLDKIVPTAQAQISWPDDYGYDELWNEPRNLVGSPRNRTMEPTRTGAVLPEGSNFEFAIPLIGLGGRGMGTNLTLYYNSRVWTRRNNSVAFDAITGWPAPGFSLGFGRVIFYATGVGGNPTGKYLLIDPDGTRHYLGSGTWADTATYQTSDGSHIRFIGNARYGGTLTYKDGLYAAITPVNNRLLPTQIYDTNGNLIDIAYKPDCYMDQGGPYCGVFPPMAIDYVSDTLGRRIEFQYDTNGRLTSITAPGFGGTAQAPVTDTLVRFDYQMTPVSYNFVGLTVEHVGGFGSSLRHVYFPATNTGHLFTYSGYGMIYNVSMRRAMTFSGGMISDGNNSASVALNYPTSSSTQLTDTPTFTQRTENATNAPQSVYSYSTSTNSLSQTKTFTITQPDSTTLNLTRSTNTSSVANGLLVQSEVKIGSSSLGKSVFTYANDAGGSPQVQSLTAYDDTGSGVKADFDYDSFGNMTGKREYGYQVNGTWQVRRRTRWTYATIGAIADRVTEIDVYDALLNTNDADDVMIAKTTCAYDNYAAMGGMEDYGGASPPGYIYFSQSQRGNLTGVSEWTDLQFGTIITHLAKYDIFGNVIKAQVSCCLEKDLTNAEATYWSQPDSETSGDPNGAHETTSTDYDFNTGLARSFTDGAGLVTNIGYDAALRPSSVTLPTGASAQADMDYSLLTSTSTQTYDDGGVTKTVTSTKQYDGWERVIQTVAPNNAQVNTAYDAAGRVASRTNPFVAGDTPGASTSIQYDMANKAVITTLPDGNTVRSNYLGNTVTRRDQVNRKIKRESDGLGRVVKVTEQDTTGALTQETSYDYNLFDKITLVNQGNQTRAYKYDAVGRLLYQKIPEQAATINDGTGTYWSTKYTYTEFDSVLTRQDARGVVTTYSYDALRRLMQVSYNTVSGVTTAPPVTYTYDDDPSYGTAAPGKLLRVNVGSDYQERYIFDDDYRITSTIRALGSRSYTSSYNYNQASQLTKLTYPSTRQLNFVYDSIGRLSEMTGYINNISYNLAGQVIGDSLGNGVTEVFSYDAARMQMVSQKAGTSSPYTNRLDLTYGYNASAGQMGAGSTAGNAGQLMTVSGTINSVSENASYTYDNAARLVTSNQTSNSGSAQRRFAYDRWGNRAGVWDATSGGNQIQSITLQQSGGVPTNRISSETSNGTYNYSYDSNGNVTSDGAHAYGYDSENRLVTLDGGVVSYAYDQQNRRYKKTVGSTVTHYLWEGGQVVAEHNANTGAVLVDYIRCGSRMIAKVAGGTTSYFLSDRLNVRLTLDTSGNAVGRQAHLPYGEDFAESGVQQKQHFTSYERDGESSLDYAFNRSYAAGVGRFLQADPYQASGEAAIPQSWNRYSYTHNDSVNLADPSGLLVAEPGGDPNGCWAITIGGVPIAIFGNCNASGPIGGGGGGNPETGSGPPINVPQPGSGKPKKCQITVRAKKGAAIIGDYPSSGRYGTVTTIGPKEIPTEDGFWGYTFEIQVKLPSDDNDPNDWLAVQWIIRVGTMWIMFDGHPFGIDVSEGGDGPGGMKPDSPVNEWIDRSHPGWLYWTDTPDQFKEGRDPRGNKQPVEFGFTFFGFSFEGYSKKDTRRNCQRPWSIGLQVKDRKASW